MQRIRAFTQQATPRKLELTRGKAISLILHACLVLLMMRMVRAPLVHPATARRLNIEVTTPHANRETVELHKSVERPPASEHSVQKEKAKEPILKPDPQPAFDLDTKMPPLKSYSDLPDALRLPETTVAPAGIAHAAGAPSQKGESEIQQRQQSVGKRNDEADLINAYVSMLSKLINGHLIYPNAARKKRLEGVSWVSFVVTDSGAIKADTLLTKTSSGYAILDKSALQTITSLIPFQRPPRELTVSLGIEFSVDR